ncbi:lysophosphatidic acid receptor 6-like [Electrophorus electricus]|uniref:lysophosphatidic acid receptor 6-like n=1 Tax=Electrophorus electricus TaxID=8005 RepID=UPI000F0A15FC|nr:lysophosphatidic acid receptor 6-like [Electrophorus electricus]
MMNNTNLCAVKQQHMFTAVLFCLVLLLGLFLNVFSMWVFCCRMPEWKAGTVLQFHLAISDVIVCPLGPVIVLYFAQGKYFWDTFWRVTCRLKIILMTVHFYGSIFFLTLISIHRYVSVVYHHQDSRMKQKDFVHKLCLGVWVAVFLKGILLVSFFDSSSNNGNITICLYIHQGQTTEMCFAINFILVIFGFLIPFTVSVVCYSRLVWSVSGISVCHPKGKLIKRKSHKMVTACLVIFGLCFMPMNVVRIAMVVVKFFFPKNCDLLDGVEVAYFVTWIVSLINCSLDPLIYCFASQKFTKAVRSSLRKIRVHIQTARQDAEEDSGLTTHVRPATGTITGKRMTMTDTR